MEKHPVWGKGFLKEKNCTLAFVYDVCAEADGEIGIQLTASNLYKLYIDDKLLGYGPARAAHGYARIDEYCFKAEKARFRVTVEVVSYQVNSYYLIMEDPFLDCTLSCDGKIAATSEDFLCYHLNDRVQKVQRYSFQRPFIESYKDDQRENLRLGKEVSYPVLETVCVQSGAYLPRRVAYPVLENVDCNALIETGNVSIDVTNPVWRDRSITDIGQTLLGFRLDELEEMVSDEVCSFRYEKDACGENPYYLYAFPILQTGLIQAEIQVDADCTIYFVFEETLLQESNCAEAANLCFHRGDCANIMKYRLKKGNYRLQSFEIYTLKYLKIVQIGGRANIKNVGMTRIETPAARKFQYRISDAKLEKIFDAAINTFSQNSLDLFMDCPGRERAGWVNDSYFTADSSRLFTGNHQLEENFIENVISAPDLKNLPAGMIPMCYPCDHIDGVYSPTCGMWFVLQTIKYCYAALDGKMPERMQRKIEKFIRFFDEFVNADGLLEDLGGWVFIEWSIANDPTYVCGVNYPANMLYYKMLLEFGKITQDAQMIAKAEAIKVKILEQSFNGKYFEDNRVRENGKLVLKGHASETCQYFAFFLGVADMQTHGQLFRNLLEHCRYDPQINKDPLRSNIIVGLLLRATLLLENGYIAQVIEETKEILYRMAARTGTLWEHIDVRCSCNHNLVSYLAVILTYALTGYRGMKDGKVVMAEKTAGIDCEFAFEQAGRRVHICVENGKASVTQ